VAQPVKPAFGLYPRMNKEGLQFVSAILLLFSSKKCFKGSNNTA
jgi:hypothetical protein